MEATVSSRNGQRAASGPAGPRLATSLTSPPAARKAGGPPTCSAHALRRAEGAFLRAEQLLPDLGPILRLELAADMPMNPSNKYYNSGWRRDTAGLPGGFLMDSSVHFIAALRTLARAAGARGAGVRRGAARAGG